jgi:hypothetical protein
MNEFTKPPNYFVRTLIVLFCIGLSLMIGYNFIAVQPIGVIKSGVFILLAILLILVLAESFDNFSIGKLISIKRDIETKKEENKKLEQKNSELLNHILSITNIQTQKQQSTNVFGDYYSENRKDIQYGKSDSDNVQELIERIGNSIVISEIEASIKDTLISKSLDIEGDTTKVLIRHLAGTQLLLIFEQIQASIFGSQIYLLKQMNVVKPNGLTELEISTHYEKVKQSFKDTFNDWHVEKYLAFLYSRALITKDENRIVHITNLGVEYLTWIARNGMTEDKPL